MVTNQVSQPAVFQDSWLSFCGAAAGALTALGRPCDVVDAAGYSGVAFLVNVTEGWTDPGSPTLHSGNVARTSGDIVALWQHFSSGLEALGARVAHFCDPEQYRFWSAEPLPADQIDRARRLYDRVRQSIDDGRPAVVWGLAVPEFGLVNGYDAERYHVSTFRHLIGQPDDPLRWDALQAKGGLEAIFFQPAPAAPDDQAAVAWALKLARGAVGPFTFDTPRHPVRERQRYVTGPAAYDEWARTLDARVPGTLYYEYNSYNAACLHAAKQAGASFVKRLAGRHASQPQAGALARAAQAYAAAEDALLGLTQLCPYAETGDLSPAQCHQGADQLRAARPHEEAAIGHLEAALSVWAE